MEGHVVGEVSHLDDGNTATDEVSGARFMRSLDSHVVPPQQKSVSITGTIDNEQLVGCPQHVSAIIRILT